MEERTITTSVALEVAAEVVFTWLVENVDTWWPDQKIRKLTKSEPVVLDEDWVRMPREARDGGPVRYARVTAWEPPHLMRLNSAPGYSLEFRLSPHADGTLVTATQHGPGARNSGEQPQDWARDYWQERLRAFAAAAAYPAEREPIPQLPHRRIGGPLDLGPPPEPTAAELAAQQEIERQEAARAALEAQAAKATWERLQWPAARLPERAEWADPADFDDARNWHFPWEFSNIALVHDLSPEEALNRFSGVRESGEAATGLMTFEEALVWLDEAEHPTYGTILEAKRLGDWTLVVENGGYQAFANHAELSAGTAAVIADWNFAHYHVVWAIDGQVKRMVDSDYLGDDGVPQVNGSVPGEQVLEQEEGLVAPGDYFSTAAALTLLQRLTGIRLTEPDLADHADKIVRGMHPG